MQTKAQIILSELNDSNRAGCISGQQCGPVDVRWRMLLPLSKVEVAHLQRPEEA